MSHWQAQGLCRALLCKGPQCKVHRCRVIHCIIARCREHLYKARRFKVLCKVLLCRVRHLSCSSSCSRCIRRCKASHSSSRTWQALPTLRQRSLISQRPSPWLTIATSSCLRREHLSLMPLSLTTRHMLWRVNISRCPCLHLQWHLEACLLVVWAQLAWPTSQRSSSRL